LNWSASHLQGAGSRFGNALHGPSAILKSPPSFPSFPSFVGASVWASIGAGLGSCAEACPEACPEACSEERGERGERGNEGLGDPLFQDQNRAGKEAEQRAGLDVQIGLLAERELTRVLQMLDAIEAKLGITEHANSELADLEMETKPENVLAEIHRIEEMETKKE
jgi:hypothetical protein